MALVPCMFAGHQYHGGQQRIECHGGEANKRQERERTSCEEFLRDVPGDRPCVRLSLACQMICPCGCNAPARHEPLRSAPAEANLCRVEQLEATAAASLSEATAASEAAAAEKMKFGVADGEVAGGSVGPGPGGVEKAGEEAGCSLEPRPMESGSGGWERGGGDRRAQPAGPAFLRAWAPTHMFEQKQCQCSGHCGNSGHRYWGGCQETSRVITNRPRRHLASVVGT